MKDYRVSLKKIINSSTILNCDETFIPSIYCPRFTAGKSWDAAKGFLQVKTGVTVLLSFSMAGGKFLPLVITKSESPTCFKDQNVPVDFKSSKSGWMCPDIFEFFLSKLDERSGFSSVS